MRVLLDDLQQRHELFPLEQARIINLLVKDVEVRPDGLNIRIFKDGLHSLSNEFTN